MEARREELAINPIDQAFPIGVDIRREERVGHRAIHPPRQQRRSEEGRGERIDHTMISHGVEISIAGGVKEMVCGLTTVTFFFFFVF